MLRLVGACMAATAGLMALSAPAMAGDVAQASPAADASATAPARIEPTPRSLELTRRYFVAMHMDKTMHATIRAMMPAVVQRMAKANPKLTPEQKSAIVQVAGESSQAMVVKMTDRLAPIFATTFTEKELEDLVAFYESPTGRALVAKSPLFAAKMGPAMKELLPTMTADMEGRLCAKVACAAKTVSANR